MKLLKTLLFVISVPALAASAYAGGCCKGDSSKDKKGDKEKASVVNVESLCACPGGGDKDGGKDKA